jgi:hypothetical protein
MIVSLTGKGDSITRKTLLRFILPCARPARQKDHEPVRMEAHSVDIE